MSEKRQIILERIRSSIDKYGYHVRGVDGGPLPRFAYTIGLYPTFGWEIVFAGGSYYSLSDLKKIVDGIAERIKSGEAPSELLAKIDLLGEFSLQKVNSSWSGKLLLGALDYFNVPQINALQIRPDRERWTIDIPDLGEIWNPAANPIWQWLDEEWEYPVSKRSVAITNLDALRGIPITEVVRWEENEWELFAGAGPDVEKSDIRIVPLGTLLGFDPSLANVTQLKIGEGLWRNSDDRVWHPWRKKNN